MSGDGLVRPANAPSGQQLYPGVQPGVSAVQFANVLLVFGSGSVGVFIYTPGTTPGPGNPPVISVTESATDPFGNPVAGGVTVNGPNGSYININSTGGIGGAVALLLRPQNAAHATVIPQLLATVLNAGAINEQEGVELTSGKAGNDDMSLQLFSASADNTIAATWIMSAGGTQFIVGNKTSTSIGTAITANAGTTGNPTNITSDAWHQATVFNNGWTALNAGFWYRLTNDKELEILGDLNGGPAGNSSIITFTGIYVPNLGQNHPAGQNNVGGTSPPWLFISPAGVLNAIGVPNAGEEIFFHIFIPVNLVNGGFG